MTGPTALRISPAWDDPGAVVATIRAAGPFWPLASYAASDAELDALGSHTAQTEFTPPWFRQDFARHGEALVAGADRILANPHFLDAARAIAGPDAVVRPTTVYVNVMGPTPFPFAPHLDVPAFRGFTRDDFPLWILKAMKTSGLFEPWRTKIVTAVSWFYDGPGGDFHYWPDGPDAPPAVEHPPFANVAVVADNEATFHGVAPLGPPGARMPTTLDRHSRLVRADAGWDACAADGTVLAHIPDAEARITTSWKADVYATAADAARADAGDDTLDLATVVDVFLADLADRGLSATAPADPLADREWVGLLADTYCDPVPAITVA
ncbi:MAG: hypothetical protein FJW95_05175 [Actinobacteria bacterium]|nr:hypothetical protein [Actinomycetota bacterium]